MRDINLAKTDVLVDQQKKTPEEVDQSDAIVGPVGVVSWDQNWEVEVKETAKETFLNFLNMILLGLEHPVVAELVFLVNLRKVRDYYRYLLCYCYCFP